VIVPLDDKPDIEDVAAATRAARRGRAERLDPDPRDDRVHSRKTGTARLFIDSHQGRRRHRGRRV